jgi:hypothetical protein
LKIKEARSYSIYDETQTDKLNYRRLFLAVLREDAAKKQGVDVDNTIEYVTCIWIPTEKDVNKKVVKCKNFDLPSEIKADFEAFGAVHWQINRVKGETKQFQIVMSGFKVSDVT